MSQIISRLDSLIKQRHDDIVDWFALQYKEQSPFFYSSVDLRHSGHKLAPVDTNLFPAGWNNISEEGCKRAVAQIKKRFDSMKTPVNNVLIIPENHTRNLAYLENLAVLQDLVEQSGRQVRIAGLTLEEPLTLTTMSGREITEYPLQRKYDILATKDGFIPDFIILNNDCTSGIPEILQGIKQEIQPHFDIGWHARRKSEHFRAYEQVAKDFSEDFGFDYRLISAAFHRCGVVNFREQKGIECVAIGVEKVLHNVRNQYAEYGIKDDPYVFVKADSGTYGMGIMTVRSGDELLEINKKTRNKMNVIKEGTQNSEVIIQEGIPTIDVVENAIAEPMIYLLAGEPVGGAYRINSERDAFSNLNAGGMSFVGMCDERDCPEKSKGKVQIPGCNFCVFGLVASLATLAASKEVYHSWDIGFSI